MDDLWRRIGRAGSKPGSTRRGGRLPARVRLGPARSLWAIKALRDEPLPLFVAAAAREQAFVPEVDEPSVPLKPMTAGRNVVEGLRSRRPKPAAASSVLPPAGARDTEDRGRAATRARCLTGGRSRVAGLVLVRQMPGSAKGVMFITIEDETGVANLVIWPALFEKQRRVVLAAAMLGVDGRVQREGEVVHIVANRLHDLSNILASVGDRDVAFPLPAWAGRPSAPWRRRLRFPR